MLHNCERENKKVKLTIIITVLKLSWVVTILYGVAIEEHWNDKNLLYKSCCSKICVAINMLLTSQWLSSIYMCQFPPVPSHDTPISVYHI